MAVKMFLMIIVALTAAVPDARQGLTQDVTAKIDAAISAAYQTAAANMPCKISSLSRSHMLRWQNVDKCLSGSVNLVDWNALSKQLAAMRPQSVSEDDFAAAIETSLTQHALTYDKVFLVKDPKALLPLTNSILKYLAPDVFANLPVINQAGKLQLGAFTSTFIHESLGGLSTTKTFPLVMFQYKDAQGKVQTPSEKPLLDSYGIPWAKVSALAGFRLTSDKMPAITGR